MKALYWRIYLTVLAALLAFALGAGWLAEQQREAERDAPPEPPLGRCARRTTPTAPAGTTGAA
ncbi:hypothetical protein [Tepidimonas taiwanensis]|uniref:hypothetical protein n=1 Tax=Tepidimonas taiwanensis TaxID=307486 RepID=UPI000733FAA5|nr:hypothetical protein [Tepidimonas taiwanensis]